VQESGNQGKDNKLTSPKHTSPLFVYHRATS